MNDINPHFRRILLKISGEALMGNQSFGIDFSVLKNVASEISAIHKLGVEVGIVIGGGNIFRGIRADALGVDVLRVITWACWRPLLMPCISRGS